MNIFRKHLETEWLMKQSLPTWREPIAFLAKVETHRPANSILYLDRILKVELNLGCEVKLTDNPEAVRLAKESVIRHLNNYFYRDLHDKLIDLTLEIQKGKDRQETVEALYKIMEDL